MTWETPNDWQAYGVSTDQTVFALPGHTPQNPKLALFDRKSPQVTAGGVSIPQFRVRIINGVSDSEGMPLLTRITADVTFRWPNSADLTAVKAAVGLLGSVLSDSGFRESAIDLQLLPTSVGDP